MTDPLPLHPASSDEIADSLSYALRFDGRKRVHHADEAMARITAERLVRHLERCGNVLMRKPAAAALERLAEADGFGGLGVDRRRALWEVRGLAGAALPLFAAADRDRIPEPEIVEAPVNLAAMCEGQQVVEGYRSTGLSLRRHPSLSYVWNIGLP